MNEDLRELFSMLGASYGSVDEMAKARGFAVNYPKILSAVVRLEELHKALEIYGISKYVSFEFDIMSDYQYYTGIIFSGYTFGSGEPVIRGGRYDKLLNYFGKNAASIGFAVVIDQLMAVLSRQKISIGLVCHGELIVYTKDRYEEAVKAAMEIRENGRTAELLGMDSSYTHEDYENYARQNHFDKTTFLEGKRNE